MTKQTRKHLTSNEIYKLKTYNSTTEVAEMLGVTPQTIRNACRRLKIGETVGNTFVLTPFVIGVLDKHLQTGSGNLTRSKK